MLEVMHPFVGYKSRKSPASRLKPRMVAGGVGLGTLSLLGMLVYHPFSGGVWPQSGGVWPQALPAISAPDHAEVPPELVWGVSWHPERLKDQPGGYKPQLKAVTDLGVGLIRFDVHWNRMQPGSDQPLSLAELPYYRALIADAKAKGLQIKVNLGGYPAWAVELVNQDPDAFFARYRPYVKAVVAALGTEVDYYQMGNEFNTILDPIPESLDGRLFKEARAEIDAAKAQRPDWQVKTVINACDTFYLPWRDDLERVMAEAADAIDVIGYDFYPGNYSHPHDWSAWQTIDYLASVMERYDKEGAICETGCPAFLGEGRQARWIAESARALQREIAKSPSRDRFKFAVFYELADDPHLKAWPPPTENSFGLVAADGRRKPGFEAFRQIIAPSAPEGLMERPFGPDHGLNAGGKQ
jgi:hypothetical protein